MEVVSANPRRINGLANPATAERTYEMAAAERAALGDAILNSIYAMCE